MKQCDNCFEMLEQGLIKPEDVCQHCELLKSATEPLMCERCDTYPADHEYFGQDICQSCYEDIIDRSIQRYRDSMMED